MRGFWLTLLLAGLAPPVLAEPIPLRSGDHPGFTRLVVQLPAGADWQITPVPSGWELDPGQPHSGFVLTNIWRPIGRNRLLDLVETDRGTLLLKSDCDCHLRAWQLGSRLVADLHDGAPRRGQGDIAKYQPAPRTDATPPPVMAAVPPPVPATPPDPGLRQAVDEAARRSSALFPSDPMELAGYAEAARRASELEASLRQALGQASATETVSDGYGVKPGADLPLSSKGEQAPVIPDAARYGMTDDGRHCPAPEFYDPGNWVALPDARPDFAGATAGLVREFDSWDQAAGLKAAKYFLYYGFGAEAAQLLAQIPPSPQRAVLMDIAAILDADDAGLAWPARGLTGWESCPSVVALWSLLAGAGQTSSQTVAAKEIVLAYQALPGHLRQVLGPGLIFAFLGRQDAATADQLRHLMRLADADPTPATRLAEIRLEEALGAEEEAHRLTDAALDSGAPPPPELLAERARQTVAQGQPLDEGTAAALEALAFEYRHHQAGPGFQKILTDHQILAGDYLGARQRLEEKLRAHDVSGWYRRLYAAAAEHADPTTLLRLTLPEPHGLGQAPRDDDVRLALAQKLLSLGFAAETLGLLGQSGTEAAQLTRAAAYLSLNQPEIALADLGQLTTPEALRLRARAQEQLGQLDAAASLYQQAGSPEDAARIALLQQEWQSAGGAPPPLAAIAEALEAQPPPAISDPYALAETLLSRSAEERRAFGWLVAPAPPPAN